MAYITLILVDNKIFLCYNVIGELEYSKRMGFCRLLLFLLVGETMKSKMISALEEMPVIAAVRDRFFEKALAEIENPGYSHTAQRFSV